MKSKCCYIPDQTQPETSRCENNAEWRIEHGTKPDDYTESCTAHVGALLTDVPEHRIYPMPAPER